MKFAYLSETVSVKKVSETNNQGHFEIDGLYTGYGLTLGNALRRVLLSSLPGAAITSVKIKGVNHEFSVLAGVAEDVVELSLNLKMIRFRAYSDEPQIATLKVKGEREVTGADIETNSQIEVITPHLHIANLTAKNSELNMELTIERGLGYVPVEAMKSEKLPIGVVALDAAFSPVVSVDFEVENMRVGDRTNYNRLKLMIETNGSITPSAALRKASNILQDHFAKVSQVEVSEIDLSTKPAKESKSKTKKK
jgi:DNA-directed RNA polymerase subunit alpha